MPVQCLHMTEPSESPAQSLRGGGGVGRDMIYAGALGGGRGEAGVIATGLGRVEA